MLVFLVWLPYLRYMNNKLNNKKMKTTLTTELKRRENLVNDESFRKVCAKVAKKVGITKEEWDNNKAIILMHFANEACKIK